MVHLDLVPLEDVIFNLLWKINHLPVHRLHTGQEATGRITRSVKVRRVELVTIARLGHPGNEHTLVERVLQIVKIIVIVVDVLAVCNLIVVLIYLLKTVVECLLRIVLIRVYHKTVRAAVVLSVLYQDVSLVCLLLSRSLVHIEFNLDDVIDQVVFVSQAEYLVDVNIRHRRSVIRLPLKSYRNVINRLPDSGDDVVEVLCAFKADDGKTDFLDVLKISH